VALIPIRCRRLNSKNGRICDAFLFAISEDALEIKCRHCGQIIRFSISELQMMAAQAGDARVPMEVGSFHRQFKDE
jgi:RNase P subunit RPR2